MVSTDLTNDVNKFLSDFNDLQDFPSKMKMVCTASLTDQERCVALDQIPLIYKNYYETLGPERCYAQGYNKTYLEKEYKDMQFDKSQLRDEIYNIFKVDEKYTKSEIKNMLKDLYKSLGYNKTPKANDLEKYFEIKLCKVTVETGKQDNGFKIIKRKENFDDLFD